MTDGARRRPSRDSLPQQLALRSSSSAARSTPRRMPATIARADVGAAARRAARMPSTSPSATELADDRGHARLAQHGVGPAARRRRRRPRTGPSALGWIAVGDRGSRPRSGSGRTRSSGSGSRARRRRANARNRSAREAVGLGRRAASSSAPEVSSTALGAGVERARARPRRRAPRTRGRRPRRPGGRRAGAGSRRSCSRSRTRRRPSPSARAPTRSSAASVAGPADPVGGEPGVALELDERRGRCRGRGCRPRGRRRSRARSAGAAARRRRRRAASAGGSRAAGRRGANPLSTSAAQVSRPQMPSTRRPRASWNARTAASVRGAEARRARPAGARDPSAPRPPLEVADRLAACAAPSGARHHASRDGPRLGSGDELGEVLEQLALALGADEALDLGSPSLNTSSVGMLITSNRRGGVGVVVDVELGDRRACPSCSAAISSSTGAIILHGPHHSAQKSTSTGRVGAADRLVERRVGEGQDVRRPREVLSAAGLGVYRSGRATSPGRRRFRDPTGVGSAGRCGRAPCSASQRSASIAAMQPVPAAVIAWRYTWSCTSPAANTPSTDVRVESGVGDDVAVLVEVELALEQRRCSGRGRWRRTGRRARASTSSPVDGVAQARRASTLRRRRRRRRRPSSTGTRSSGSRTRGPA